MSKLWMFVNFNTPGCYLNIPKVSFGNCFASGDNYKKIEGLAISLNELGVFHETEEDALTDFLDWEVVKTAPRLYGYQFYNTELLHMMAAGVDLYEIPLDQENKPIGRTIKGIKAGAKKLTEEDLKSWKLP